jgi:predicted RNase H-like HicB family nuclease
MMKRRKKQNMTKTFTAYVEKDPDTGLYVAIAPGVPGAHTQGATLDELQENLKEVISLILEDMAERGEEIETGHFVGIQQIEISA